MLFSCRPHLFIILALWVRQGRQGLKPHNPHYTGVLQEETVTSDNPHMLFGPPIKCLLNVLASELTSVAALKEDSLAYCYSQLLGGNGP